ncbi:enoyl-ACP reductase [Lysinibacillus sp. BF-4]|uniref:Enoyl-[acyl-carrier-protein] reductase [NADH] n=1 Tax=Metalysinibacillus saudimassiliensis TaxID=1461583 RepID=A0A078MET7_9BACL|nr:MULTISPECIES: enoyl-ACP reductase FabI [Bacillales]KFL44482.1 enoyl-ACP reductase [Lysinibacillus sp. BF-4]CEA04760.1 Enoyl-[acyl-carrier-protein] reductase [NADH] FabI [Metalysinibacillus saudimassiliensis]
MLQLTNKNIVVMGVANDRSIAWGIAKKLFDAGANVIFTYRQERSLKKLTQLLEKNDQSTSLVVQCDVNDDASTKQAFTTIGEKVGVIHGVVHSVAFANGEDLKNRFLDTSRDGYAFAQDTSAYSLIAAAKAAHPYMTEGGSIVTMSYLGAERVLDGYNVMGVAKAALEASMRYLAADIGQDNIRVNAISAGAIRTLAAKGVPSFNTILHKIEETAPLKRNVQQDEVADMTLVMLSPLSRGVTGETIYVDGGYNIMG